MKLLIAVPTLDSVPVEFCESLAGLAKRLTEDGVDFTLKFESGSLVYLAREALGRAAVAGRYSHVLWLDSDMVFTPDLLDALAFSGRPFVSGIAHSRRGNHSSCLFKSLTPAVERWTAAEYPRDTFQVAACGFAAVLMEVKVLEAVHERGFPWFLPLDGFGEDVAFCWRAGQVGYKPWAEPGARLGHVGKVTIWPEDEKT